MLDSTLWRRFALCASIALSLAASAPAASERPWLDGFAMAVLDSDDIPSLHRARATIELHGGRVALMHEPNVLMGWFPQATIDELTGQDNIRAFYTRETQAELQAAKHAQSARAIASFNDIVSGRYEARIAQQNAQKQQSAWPEGLSDLEPQPTIDETEYLDALRGAGLDPAELQRHGKLDFGKNESDAMSGTISTTIFFVESDGTGTDPNLYDWTSQDVQDYINGVNVGLAWWSQMAGNYGTCWNAYFVRWQEPTDPRSSQWREITLHNSSFVPGMVDDVLTNYGFPGSHFSQTAAYNTWQVSTYGTDRAYCAFVAYNEGGPSQLTDGRAAWAYLLGPYTFLLFNSYSWRPDQVFTHETGHIFGACDEYGDSGCTSAQYCNNGFTLGNCENSPGFAPCMMASNTFTLCNFTDGHIGWRFSPCAPPPLAPPVALTADPPSAKVGTSFDLTITGSDFLYGAYVNLGNGVTLNSTQFVDGNEFVVNLTVDELADPGPRTITVLNRDLQSDQLVGVFSLVPTSRHYVDPMGSALWPYTTRATAAHTLTQVLTATGKGDSILVASTSIVQPPIAISKDAKLYGGWDGSFEARDAENDRTTLQLTGNLRIQAQVTLDGFILRDGNGLGETLPIEGTFGGAVTVRNANATIQNCELTANDAYDLSGNGGGGAIYAFNSTLTLRDSEVHGNLAQNGAALYLRNSNSTLERAHLHDNTATHPVSARYGGGIYAVGGTLSLFESTIESNPGAKEGGAIYATGLSSLLIDGSTLATSSSLDQGGALLAGGGTVLTIVGSHFESNSTGTYGGAIALIEGSNGEIADSIFRANQANLGGALYATGGALDLHHNLFNANTGNLTGASAYLNAVPSGRFYGNTLYGELTGGGATAVLFSNSPLTTQNNIVAHTTGSGFFCGGVVPMDHNLMHANSAGNYSSCAPGPASITGDPLFVDPLAGDFHLGLHSPALDAGEPGASDPDGGAGDLGIYGSHAVDNDQPSYPKNPDVQISGSDVIVSWDGNPEPDIASYVVYGSTSAGFTPDAASMLATVAAPAMSANLGANANTHFRVVALDGDGYSSGFSAEVERNVVSTDGPRFATRLLGNAPNPFNPSTVIRFELAERMPAELRIFDVSGRLLRTLWSGRLDAGPHALRWDGRDGRGELVRSGVYFYRLEAGEERQTEKMLLVK